MRDKVLLMLLALLVAGGVGGFFYFFESYDTERSTGFSIKARQQPFLAAQQFLLRVGKAVEAENSMLDFTKIDTDDVVFLSRVDSILLTEKQIDGAVNWLQQGGQMIIGAGRETGSQDSLLARFDITAFEQSVDDDWFATFGDTDKKLSEQLRQENERIDAETDQALSNQSASGDLDDITEEDDDAEDEWRNDIVVNFQGQQKPLQVRLDDTIFLQQALLHDLDDDTEDFQQTTGLDYNLIAWTENEIGAHLLQFEIGDGMLSVLSSSELWKNYHIDHADNAYLLAALVGDANRVHFFFNLSVPSLRQLLMRYFPEALAGLIAALLLWLWRNFVRVVRIKDDMTTQRRALSEHLAATTELFIKHQRYDLLVAPIVADIEQHTSHRVSDFAQQNDDEKIKLLAQHSGLEQQLIQHWLQAAARADSNEAILQVIKIGKLIRNKL